MSHCSVCFIYSHLCALFIPDPSTIETSKTSLISRARLFARKEGTEGTAPKGDKVSRLARSEQRKEVRGKVRKRKGTKEARSILVQCM